ncbi:MAG: 3-dehydroquinate synthase [Syntrophales bacterium]|jgi:3-dehydroquinate synthase|nr:3-dehydroquinate synthase [Syntrophales bacterium]
MRKLELTLKKSRDDSYQINIGEGILDWAGMTLGKSGTASHCVVVTDSTIDALHGERVQKALEKAGLRIERIVLPPGEETKTMASVLEVAERLISLGADRQTLLVALGGGVIGDLTGFVASLYMRGIPFVQMPTTLLAQVDSSIGGKTGVDAVSGKNILGTFYQPQGVFIDTEFLKTLPDAIFRSGFAEVIKYGAIENPSLLKDIEKAAGKNGLRDSSFLTSIVIEACRIKKSIVELDEREGGLRRILNFGHTIGHAVEATSGYKLSHGEAVAIGMAAAARLSEKLHGLPAGDGERIKSVLRAVGFQYMIPAGIDIDAILARLSMDKKAELNVHEGGGKIINFVMIRRLGKPFIQGGIREEILRETLEELSL